MATFTTETGLTLDEADPDDRKILQRQRAAAREQGKSGADRAASTRGRADLESAYDEGAGEAAAPSEPAAAAGATGKAAAAAGSTRSGSRSGSSGKGGESFPKPTLKPPRTVNVHDSAGFAFGLIVYALVVSYIRYGSAGPKGWLAAKFLNKPIQGDDLEKQNRKDSNNGVDPNPSGTGPNGEKPAEGHLDPNQPIL